MFHMVMLFVQASGRAYIFDKIHWIMGHNPNFGKVTYSHLSLYYAEFVCVAHRDLEALERQGFLTTLTLSGIESIWYRRTVMKCILQLVPNFSCLLWI